MNIFQFFATFTPHILLLGFNLNTSYTIIKYVHMHLTKTGICPPYRTGLLPYMWPPSVATLTWFACYWTVALRLTLKQGWVLWRTKPIISNYIHSSNKWPVTIITIRDNRCGCEPVTGVFSSAGSQWVSGLNSMSVPAISQGSHVISCIGSWHKKQQHPAWFSHRLHVHAGKTTYKLKAVLTHCQAIMNKKDNIYLYFNLGLMV